jgi:hypothetical protein
MIDTPSTTERAEQARLELAIAAGARERSNRPRTLVYLGVALVGVAAIVLLAGVSSRGAAQLELASRRADLEKLVKSRDELVALNRQIEARGLASDPRMAGKIEALAQAAGVRLVSGVSDTAEVGNVSGMVRRIYTAQVQPGEDPRAIFDFLASTQTSDQTRWLEISQLRINPAPPVPGKGSWSVDVRFARMERTEARR